MVKAMTGGNFDTSVAVNEMYNQSFTQREPFLGATFAVILSSPSSRSSSCTSRTSVWRGRTHDRRHRPGPAGTIPAEPVKEKPVSAAAVAKPARPHKSSTAGKVVVWSVAIVWTTIGLLVSRSDRSSR